MRTMVTLCAAQFRNCFEIEEIIAEIILLPPFCRFRVRARTYDIILVVLDGGCLQGLFAQEVQEALHALADGVEAEMLGTHVGEGEPEEVGGIVEGMEGGISGDVNAEE